MTYSFSVYAAYIYIFIYYGQCRPKQKTEQEHGKKIPQHLWQQSHKLSRKKSAEVNNYTLQELQRPRGKKILKFFRDSEDWKAGLPRAKLKWKFHIDYLLSEWTLKSFLVFKNILWTLSFRTPSVVNMYFKWATDEYELEEKPSSSMLFPKTDSTTLCHSWHISLVCS